MYLLNKLLQNPFINKLYKYNFHKLFQINVFLKISYLLFKYKIFVFTFFH